MVLCHLLNTFCLPILLYGLEAVPLSHANFTTLQSTCRVALYKIFRVRDVNNLLYTKLHEYFTYNICSRFEKASSFT